MSLQPPVMSLPTPSIFATPSSSPPASSIVLDQRASHSLSATYSSLSSQYPATTTDTSTKSTGPPIAIIVGVIAGVLVVVIGTAVWFILRRRRQRRLANHDFNDDKDNFSRGRVSMSLRSFTRSKPSDNQNLRHGRHDGDGLEGERSSSSSSGRGRDLEQQPPQHQRQQSGHGHYLDNTGNNHTPQKSQQPDGSPSTFYDFSSYNDNNSTSTSPRQYLDQIESSSSRAHRHHHHHNHSDNEDASSCTITMSTTSSPSPPVSMVSSSTPIPPSKQSIEINSFLKPEVKNDVHIDMVSMDLEVLLPVIISDEILVISSPEPTVSQVGSEKSSTRTNVDESSIEMPVPVPRRRPPSLATHRSPESFIQGGRARISMCHPPPPPPPTNPPPEIPKDTTCPMAASRRSRTSTYLSGRRSMSVDNQSKGGGSRSSVHWKDVQEEDGYLRRDSTSSLSSSTTVAPLSPVRSRANSSPTIDFSSIPVNRCPRTNKIILPPSSPPPPLPSSPPLNPRGRARQSHQRSPSQVLSSNFWTSPQLPSSSLNSPTLSSTGGPISPPLSPLTVQIPRPISKAFLNNTGISAAGSRPESPIISGSNSVMTARSSPSSSSLSHLPIPTRVVRQQQQQVHLLMQQEKRSRSHSLGDNENMASPTETHRIIISPSTSASSSNCPSPQYPPVPSPPVPQSYLLLRRPSLVLQEQQAMSGSGGIYSHSGDPFRLSRPTGAITGLGLSRPFFATRSSSIAVPDSGRKSSEPPFKSADSHQKQRRSMSLDSAAAAAVIATCAAASSSSDCPSSSTAAHAMREVTEHGESTVGGHDDAASDVTAAASSSADQELQSIIADAIAIAAAKTAAIEAARHSTWYRQHQHRYQQMYQHQSLEAGLTSTVSHRPWTPTPSEDYFPPWGSPSGAPSNSTSSSRSASPFHSSGSPS